MTAERAQPLPPDLLTRLSLALHGSKSASELSATLASCAWPESVRARVLEQALRVGERARAREPRPSLCELELSLGVVLILCGVVAGAPPAEPS